MENVRTIFFDYDGTLHDSFNIYAPSFLKAYEYLVKEGFANKREWKRTEISYWLGFNPEEMWDNFIPQLPGKVKQFCNAMISNNMKYLIEEGLVNLYEGALETLEYLKQQGYTMIFLSNCKIYYKESHNRLFNLDRYFTRMVSSEEFNYIPKYEILEKIKGDYPKEMVIVGDRFHDLEAGKMNNIYTIGCNYGYALQGELEQADMIIDNINELRNIL